MQNPKFGVTAFTATVLTIICVGKVLLYPLLPPSQSEKLVTLDQRNAPPAAAVELDWQTDPKKAVETATKLRKALLWVIIDPRDKYARELETNALRDAEVVRLVKRYFVPVKLSSDDHPDVEKLIFPIGRVQSYLRSGATVLATTPSGHLIGMIRPRGAGDRLSTPAILAQLIGVKKRLDELIAKPEVGTELDEFGRAELQRLAALTPGAPPDGSELLDRIKLARVATKGVFSSNGFGEIRPSTLDLLLELGEINLATAQVNAYCTSAGYDVLGGGVFDGIELSNPSTTLTSKSVLTNAAFAETLAKLIALGNDPNHRQLLDDTLRCIKNGFVFSTSVFEGQVSDADESGLSPSLSLTGARIDSKLTPAQAAWVRNHLLPNPAPRDYLGRFDSLGLLTDPVLAEIRQKLRSQHRGDLQRTRENRAFVVGFVCARLLRIYELTGNPTSLELFRQLEPILYGCIEGEVVFRIASQPFSGLGWLGSYLSVADALLQQYVVLKEQKALTTAAPILRGLIGQFGASHSSWLTTTAKGESPIPGLAGTSPELSDPAYESTTATAIRVLDRYEAVLPDRKLAKTIHDRAAEMISNLAPLVQGGNITASGVVRESLSVMRGRRIEVVGKIKGVAAAFPLEFVCPHSPTATVEPGVYIYRTGARTGPFTIQEAKTRLASQ